MTFDWQNVIALALVGTAVVYLGRMAWRIAAKSNRSRCGGCSSCAAQTSEPDVVTLGALKSTKNADR